MNGWFRVSSKARGIILEIYREIFLLIKRKKLKEEFAKEVGKKIGHHYRDPA